MTSSCRACGAPLEMSFVDLGKTPLANAYLAKTPEAIAAEQSYPLHVKVCSSCLLVQVEEAVPADAIFKHDYAYLSSYSKSWVEHAKTYAEMMVERFGLSSDALAMEIASNDGYLLQHFLNQGIKVLGVEPAGHAAELAQAKGVDTRVAFFNRETALKLKAEGITADVIAANNVLAHVPDIKGFLAGFQVSLKPQGVATFEFPHLLNLIELVQFDTIYHEHYSYLSLFVVEKLLRDLNMRVFDVQQWPTHGGSLRVFACHDAATHTETLAVASLRAQEAAAGMNDLAGYRNYADKVEAVKQGFAAFLQDAKAKGKTIAAYGAAAKGNTFLNVCGIGANDGISFCVDLNPEKQNRLLPGSHIPVFDPSELQSRKPDYVLILPWNLAKEISAQHSYISQWGGSFVTAVPQIKTWA